METLSRRILIWGGYDGTRTLKDGARYDPHADAWQPLASLDRERGSILWTGDELLAWNFSGDITRYDFASNEWR